MNDQKSTAEALEAAARRIFPNYDERVKRAEEQRREREREWQERLAQEEKRLEERRRWFMRMEDNITLFFQTEGLYVHDPDGRITSGELYNLYKQWCIAENIPLHPPRAFWLHAKKHAAEYRLVYATSIPDQTGKRCRGFYGIRPLGEEERKHLPAKIRDGAEDAQRGL